MELKAFFLRYEKNNEDRAVRIVLAEYRKRFYPDRIPFWRSFWERLPKIRLLRTYPRGFEVVITCRRGQYNLFGFFLRQRPVRH